VYTFGISAAGWTAAFLPFAFILVVSIPNTHTPSAHPLIYSDLMGDNHTNITCIVVDPDTVECGGEKFYRQDFLKDTQVMFWAYLGAYIALVLFAGEREGPN